MTELSPKKHQPEEIVEIYGNRRDVLAGTLALASLSLFPLNAMAQTPEIDLPLTPGCGEHDEPTLATNEGPYFRPNSLERHDLLEPGMAGRKLTIGGFVLDTQCRPKTGALIELWHANDVGRYDLQSSRLRGHHYSDSQGRWWFSTIIPAPYDNRTRHFHFKVQRPDENVLTTQLFFPGEAKNQRDYQFDQRLLLSLNEQTPVPFGRFDFVL